MNTNDPIPFTAFARFERLTAEKPLLYCEPPAWAAASHAIVVGDTVHYLWAKKGGDGSWVHMHSSAPVADPTAVTHDQRNPILLPSADGFDNHGVEYPSRSGIPPTSATTPTISAPKARTSPAANRLACWSATAILERGRGLAMNR
ncbi:MAG: hypothetical protein OXH81_17975 [Gemmatimonadetes bacterium]|nr:hypothetical protein [Gemmatimonadota bacterium]